MPYTGYIDPILSARQGADRLLVTILGEKCDLTRSADPEKRADDYRNTLAIITPSIVRISSTSESGISPSTSMRV